MAASALLGQALLQVQPLEAPTLPILGYANVAAACDLDADGDDDLVVGEQTGPVILRWQPTGFVRQTFASGLTGLTQVVVAQDFDNDGRADLLLGPYPSLQPFLRVWWGDGTGQFPTVAFSDLAMPLGAQLNSVVAANDFDNDGDTDFVITSPVPSQFPGSVLWCNLGNRSFTIAPSSQFPAAPGSTCVPFSVDIDGDGWRDVVLVSEDARTRLYWNNAGNFTEATTAQFPVIQASLRGLAVADLDGDGDRDVVLGGNGVPGLFLRMVGPRQLVLGPGSPTDVRTVDVEPIDLDGDGDLDLRVVTRDQIHERSNDGTGLFTLSACRGGCEEVRHLVRVDLDGDGDRDVLRFGLGVPSGSSPSLSALYTVTTTRLELIGASRLPASSTFAGITSGDINGDGLPDFAMDNNEPSGLVLSTMQFLTNDGRGVFGFRWANRIGDAASGFFVDLNHDGFDEFVITGPGTVTGYFANAAGTLAATKILLPIGSAGQIVTSGAGIDLDGDGDLDLVFALEISGNYVVRTLMNGPGGFVDDSANRVSGPFGSGQHVVLRRGDFDGDGDQDVWLHSWSDDQLWLNQSGILTFVPGAVPINGYGGSEGTMGDFDGDGDIDLTSGPKLLRNQGGLFVFVPNAIPNVLGNDSARYAVDIDDDGDLDLIGSGIVFWNNGAGVFSLANSVLPFAWGTGQGVRVVDDFDLDGDADVVTFHGGTHVTSVLINQLRQLRLEATGRLGDVITFRYSTRPGETAYATATVLACSFAETPPTMVPGIGWLRIDATQAILLGPYVIPAAGGEVVHQESVPPNPALIGMFLCAQPLELRGSRLRLGNFVSTWIGR